MFGSTIADYIYSLEQANAGAGVAWFRKLFPKPYYAYNAGELLSVNTSEHGMTGFNQWDGSDGSTGPSYRYWDIPIGATNKLYLTLKDKGTTVDLSDIYIGFAYDNVTSGAPTGYRWVMVNGVVQSDHSNVCLNGINVGKLARYLTVYPNKSATFAKLKQKYDICVNISWDGERDGEYEPYVKRTYALDSDLTLRGIPKLDSGNNLYYDGDTYESDGTVTRRYGIVDLGTLTWGYSNGFFRTTGLNATMKKPADNNTPFNGICALYMTKAWNYDGDDKIILASKTQSDQVLVKNSAYTDAATFKTAMSGVYLVYELATETTEEADSYQNPQIVDDWGTEEYVDYAESQNTRDVAIPVGHETIYAPNLRAKLEMSPDSPDGNGDYLVRQTNGQNEYVEYVSPVPTAPTENGTYVLKVTVSGGTPTLSWVAES